MSLRSLTPIPIANLTEFVMPSVDPATVNQNAAIGILAGLTAVSSMIVCTRLLGRLSARTFGMDDALICIAMVLNIVESVTSFMVIKLNFIGVPAANIPPHDPTAGIIWTYVTEILYNPILTLVKTSILIFLLRLFGQKPGVRQYIVWLHTVNIVQMIAFFLAITFQCVPIEKTWNLNIEGTCIDRRVAFVTSAAVNITTDLLVLVLPLKIFMALKIPLRTKMALMLVFMLGALTTIAGIVRMILFAVELFMLEPLQSTDISFVSSAVEANLALITASAPALRPLLRAWFPHFFGVNKYEVEGCGLTERNVLGTTGTRITRVKSGTELRSQTTRQSEEQAMTYNRIVHASKVGMNQLDGRDLGNQVDKDITLDDKRMGRWF